MSSMDAYKRKLDEAERMLQATKCGVRELLHQIDMDRRNERERCKYSTNRNDCPVREIQNVDSTCDYCKC